MKILIVYGTTEGRTRKIAQFMADRLAGLGCQVSTVEAVDAGGKLDPGKFDAALIAASLHAGHYQRRSSISPAATVRH